MSERKNERKLGSSPERATGWEGACNEFSARNVDKNRAAKLTIKAKMVVVISLHSSMAIVDVEL